PRVVKAGIRDASSGMAGRRLAPLSASDRERRTHDETAMDRADRGAPGGLRRGAGSISGPGLWPERFSRCRGARLPLPVLLRAPVLRAPLSVPALELDAPGNRGAFQAIEPPV